jgi:hypothetical protein
MRIEMCKKVHGDKYDYSITEGVKLLYYANEKHNFPYKVFLKKDVLLEQIKRG